MDRVSRCPQCTKHLVPTTGESGRTELRCMFCEKLDPMEIPTVRQWADSPLAQATGEPA
jgi:hypothetical protein